MSQSRKNSLFKSSAVMAVATICSRLLGLVREQLMALYFGASGLTDGFLLAFRIPNLLRDLFAEGAFSSAFVPTFVEEKLKSHSSARALLWSLFWILGSITLIISFLIFCFAPELVDLFSDELFKQNKQKYELTITLVRIMAPFLFFVSIAALFMGVLNSLKFFFIPALAPATFNVSLILSMLILPSILIANGQHPILSLGIGVLIGGLFQVIFQIPLIRKSNLGPEKSDFKLHSRAPYVFKKLGPGLLGFAATQINLLINTILATGTVVGAVSWLSYAFRLFQLPVGILSVSIGNSNLVHFSNALKSQKKEEAKDVLKESFVLTFLVVLPAFSLMYFNSELIVSVLFERGKFDAFASQQTALALKFYLVGLPFYSLYKLLVPSFYALEKPMIPVYCSIISIIINIIFCLTFIESWGFSVLAFGTTISMFVNVIIQFFLIKKELHLELLDFFTKRVIKVMAAFILSLFIAYLLKDLRVGEGLILGLISLSLRVLGILISYCAALFVLGERSWLYLARKLLKKVL